MSIENELIPGYVCPFCSEPMTYGSTNRGEVRGRIKRDPHNPKIVLNTMLAHVKCIVANPNWKAPEGW